MTPRLGLLALLPVLFQSAQSPSAAVITFSYSNPALQPARYSLQVQGDGTAHYHADGSGTTPGGFGTIAPEFDRDLRLDDGLRSRLETETRANKWFATVCESKHGARVAFTGDKTFSYAGPEGQGSCTFNYAQDARLEQLSNDLIAVAATLEEGRRLEMLLAHDKLGLDAELQSLAAQAAGSRALDLGNIAPVLQAIASNDEVLTHTRARASALLPR